MPHTAGAVGADPWKGNRGAGHYAPRNARRASSARELPAAAHRQSEFRRCVGVSRFSKQAIVLQNRSTQLDRICRRFAAAGHRRCDRMRSYVEQLPQARNKRPAKRGPLKPKDMSLEANLRSAFRLTGGVHGFAPVGDISRWEEAVAPAESVEGLGGEAVPHSCRLFLVLR